MKASRAFSSTFKFVTVGVNRIFSLVYFRLFPSDNYLPVPLILFGKIAKYLIGFPLGALMGVLAAITIGIFNVLKAATLAIINFFKTEKDENICSLEKQEENFMLKTFDDELMALDRLEQPITDLIEEKWEDLEASNDEKQNDNVECGELLQRLVEMPTEEKAVLRQLDIEAKQNEEKALELVEKEKLLQEQKKISERSLIEKKNSLSNKIDLLIQVIYRKILFLDPKCKAYEDTLENCKQLKSQLQKNQDIAQNAKKLIYTETIKTKVSCLCGFSSSLMCPQCCSPVMRSEIRETIATYVPDEEKRSSAKVNCNLIAKELEFESKLLIRIPVEYERRKELSVLKNKLQVLFSLFSGKNEINLDNELNNYMKILNEVESFFLDDKMFKKVDFLPKSNYSQLIVSSKLIHQLKKHNEFFQAIPNELLEKIGVLTASLDFPQGEASKVFRSY